MVTWQKDKMEVRSRQHCICTDYNFIKTYYGKETWRHYTNYSWFQIRLFFFNPLFSKFLSNAIIRKLFIGLPGHESRVLTRSPQLRFFLLRFYFLKSLVLKLSLNHFFVIPSIKNVRIYLSFNSVLTALWDIKEI